jgi:opacity protein-like surface antigen
MRRHALLLTFALCAILCRSASAQTNLGLQGVGAAAGIVSPDNLDTTFGIGAFADMGVIVPRLHLEPRIDFWSDSEDVFGGGGFSVRDITLGARVKYYFPVANPKLKPFAGGGLGLNFFHVELEMMDPFTGGTMTSTDSSTKLGLDLGGGLATPLSLSTHFVAELWYGAVSDFSHLTLRVGVLHALGS